MDEDKRTLIRTIIVEDNTYLREAWSSFIDQQNDMCLLAGYGSCEEALNNQVMQRADFMLLDIGLPGMSGTDGITHFLKVNEDLIIVMATVFEDDHYIFDALSNGAVGYLQKKVTPPELVEAIRSAYNGGSPMSPEIARKVTESFRATRDYEITEKLSEREKEILNYLAEGKTYSAIGEEIHLSLNGVRYHIRNIYRKLQVNSCSEAVAKALNSKIIRPD